MTITTYLIQRRVLHVHISGHSVCVCVCVYCDVTPVCIIIMRSHYTVKTNTKNAGTDLIQQRHTHTPVCGRDLRVDVGGVQVFY